MIASTTPDRIGRYPVIRELGAGGQARVFLCRDEDHNRDVAVKLLLPQALTDQNLIKRFELEARLAGAIRHPNVCSIFEVGRWQGQLYYVMEALQGSLKDLIEKEGALEPYRAAGIAYQVSLGLQAAHERGIVHRDIKPHNILLSADGTPKLCDFGIARAVDITTLTLASLTGTRGLIGTVPYMSPEQGRTSKVDIRADIYSLGCVMYQMVTGRVPFDADTPWAVIEQHQKSPPPSIDTLRSGVPVALRRVIEKCLEKDPKNRFQRPRELADALENVVPGLGGAYKPTAEPLASTRALRLTVLGEEHPEIGAVDARVLALEQARLDRESYPPGYVGKDLIWDVVEGEEEETRDYFRIVLSYRPAGTFTGIPGQEEFRIGKDGELRLRRIQSRPERRGVLKSRRLVSSKALGLASGTLAAAVVVLGVLPFTALKTPADRLVCEWFGVKCPVQRPVATPVRITVPAVLAGDVWQAQLGTADLQSAGVEALLLRAKSDGCGSSEVKL